MTKALIVVALVFLAGCSLPLVGSLGGNGVTAMATGQYERSIITSGVDILVHAETGKTPTQHIFKKKKEK